VFKLTLHNLNHFKTNSQLSVRVYAPIKTLCTMFRQ